VVESGSHDQLIAHSGLYARLHAMQFAPAESDAAEEPLRAAAGAQD
jgi:hypothetical protein